MPVRPKDGREGWSRRTRQFFVSIADMRGLDAKRRAWVKEYLNPAEEALFYRMVNMDQVHCVRVAQTALQLVRSRSLGVERTQEPTAVKSLVRAALLHDVGKSVFRLSIFTRVLLVLLRHVVHPRPKSRLGQAFWVHENHPSLGAELAERAGVETSVTYLIRHHHSEPDGETLQSILREADRRS